MNTSKLHLNRRAPFRVALAIDFVSFYLPFMAVAKAPPFYFSYKCLRNLTIFMTDFQHQTAQMMGVAIQIREVALTILQTHFKLALKKKNSRNYPFRVYKLGSSGVTLELIYAGANNNSSPTYHTFASLSTTSVV